MDTYQYAMAVLAAVFAIIAAIVHGPAAGSSGSSGSSHHGAAAEATSATAVTAVTAATASQPTDQPSEPAAGGQDTTAPNGTEQGSRLHVRNVYNCPTPGDVDGRAQWRVYNTTGLALNVYVSDDEGNAYQVLERIGSPAERAWAPKLSNGTYHLTCVFHNDSAVKSGDFRVSGSPFADTPKMVPITDREIAAVSVAQAASQKQRVPELQQRAHELVDAVRSGDRPRAQRAYLAYLETYRSFDDSSEMWPGPGLDGYEDVETLLWSAEPVSAAAQPAADLAAAVDATADALATSHFAIPQPDYGLRAHEVMEEFERFDMRGERDFGAHALPVALRGDVRSTRATLDPLRELVEGRGLDTAPIYAQLDELDRLADEMDAKYDVAYREWEQQDRLRLQAEVARANELLAPVATMTVIRRMN